MRTLLALWLLFAASGTVCADTLHGVVIVVIDGDTVLFKPDHYSPGSRAFLKVRLAGIDAPEQDQPHGVAATRALSALLLNQRVEVNSVAIDTYGRTIAHIRVRALRVNQEMVRRGLVWASTRGRDQHGLLALQREARRERIGLWQDPAPMPPWAWRRAQPARGH